MSDTCPARFILVGSITVIFVEQYSLRSSSLCIFHPSVTVSVFGPDVLVITDTVQCSFFLTKKEQNSLSLTHGAEPFLRSCQLCSHSRTSHRFMEPEGSLPRPQEPSTGPCAEPDRSNPYHPISLRSILILSTRLRLGLSSGLFPRRNRIEKLYFHRRLRRRFI
jgi:hypothetical protein